MARVVVAVLNDAQDRRVEIGKDLLMHWLDVFRKIDDFDFFDQDWNARDRATILAIARRLGVIPKT